MYWQKTAMLQKYAWSICDTSFSTANLVHTLTLGQVHYRSTQTLTVKHSMFESGRSVISKSKPTSRCSKSICVATNEILKHSRAKSKLWPDRVRPIEKSLPSLLYVPPTVRSISQKNSNSARHQEMWDIVHKHKGLGSGIGPGAASEWRQYRKNNMEPVKDIYGVLNNFNHHRRSRESQHSPHRACIVGNHL